MALPKTKARLIIIDNVKYHWLVSPNSGYNKFIAQKEETNGRIIEAYFAMYLPSAPNHCDANYLQIIKPKESEVFIRQALQLGWNPNEHGKPVVFDIIDNQLQRRSQQ